MLQEKFCKSSRWNGKEKQRESERREEKKRWKESIERKKTTCWGLAKVRMRWASPRHNRPWQSAPYADSVQDFGRQDTRSGAVLVTTGVLADIPSWRLGQWRPPVNCTNYHCNPITRKAPQLLHGRTAGSPCRDGDGPESSIASITDPKQGVEKGRERGTRRRKRRGKRKAEKYLVATSHPWDWDCLWSWDWECKSSW